MSEMIERVAKALFALNEAEVDWAEESEGVKDMFRDDARAAIEAMREPTEAMWAAGTDARLRESPSTNEVWREMIDAALSEKTKDITVACKCGWQGRQSELNGNLCPKCGAPFKSWP